MFTAVFIVICIRTLSRSASLEKPERVLSRDETISLSMNEERGAGDICNDPTAGVRVGSSVASYLKSRSCTLHYMDAYDFHGVFFHAVRRCTA